MTIDGRSRAFVDVGELGDVRFSIAGPSMSMPTAKYAIVTCRALVDKIALVGVGISLPAPGPNEPSSLFTSTLSMSRRIIPLLAILASSSAFQPVSANVDHNKPGAGSPERPPAVACRVEFSSPEWACSASASSGQKVAHAIVVRTSPEESGVAPETIGKVDVWYDAGIRDDFAALAVIDANGDRVDKRDAAIDRGDQSHVSTSVGILAPGTYTVRYRALSADGHIVSGAWVFEVRPKE